jgi:hypothetical protein
MMHSPNNSQHLDRLRLENDLRNAYVELLSAQFAVDRLQARYKPEDVASLGNSFPLIRSLSAANIICSFFSRVERSLPSRRAKTGDKPGLDDAAY